MTSQRYPNAVSNKTMLERISTDIDRALENFHIHCKRCRHCRNPVQVYQRRQEFCVDGKPLVSSIIELLYLKAEHVPRGTFTVEHYHGWTEVFELIQVITHNKQGKYGTEIIDLKRARPASPPLAIEDAPSGRGSQYDEDMRRKREADSRALRTPPHSPQTPPRKMQRINNVAYADPRTSTTYLGIPPQDFQPGSPASSNGSSSGVRSVRFDKKVHVREFQT